MTPDHENPMAPFQQLIPEVVNCRPTRPNVGLCFLATWISLEGLSGLQYRVPLAGPLANKAQIQPDTP